MVSPSEHNPSTTASLASLPEYHLDYALWDPADVSSGRSQSFVRALRRAMVGIGCFYLHNTPLDSGDTRMANRRANMFSLCERLFDLPLKDRLAIDVNDSRHFRGYCRFGDECFGPNQFLHDAILPGHQEIVTDWFTAANEICRQLTRAVELALGVQEGRLIKYLDGSQPVGNGAAKDEELDKLGPLPFARMRTIRYPAGEVVDGSQRIEGSEQGVGAHKDIGWLTLLATSSVGGLEAQGFDGKWIPAPHVEGSIIVNFGQQIENLTCGIVQSAIHRVIIPPTATQTRYSVAWFAYPALNALLRPLDVASEFSDEVLGLWKEAVAQRQGSGNVSEMPKDDLLVSQHERFGWVVWRRRGRSHPDVVKRFYTLQ
ncbi:hypothetical protein BGZ72_008368 [Mortierella alpina]|nr:hypothetical protein BGZ72_008368 [Mortierella alpina]